MNETVRVPSSVRLVRLLWLALLPGSWAHAQTFDASDNRSFLSPSVFARADCDNAEPARLTLRGTTPAGASLEAYLLEATSGGTTRPSCLDRLTASSTSTPLFAAPLLAPSGSFTEEIDVPREALLEGACGVDAGIRRNDQALCVYLLSSLEDQLDAIGFFVAVDTVVPSAPTIETALPGDRRIRLTVPLPEEGLDVYEVLLQARPCSLVSDAGVEEPTVDGGVTSENNTDGETLVAAESICSAPGDFTQTVYRSAEIELANLENGVTYELRALLRDDFANVSVPSEPVLVTPTSGVGPMDLYDGAGSPFSVAPSCGTTSSAPRPLLWLGVVLLLSPLARPRRSPAFASVRRTGVGATALLVVLGGFASPAVAHAASPKGITLSLYGGPNRPAIDRETTPAGEVFPLYACFFDDQTLVELGAGLGYHLFDAFGVLEVGFSVSGSQARGNTLAPAAVGLAQCGEKSDDSIELTLLKLAPQLTYRFDPLLDVTGFPLVPYGRIGGVAAGYAFTSNGNFPTGATAAQNPLGAVFGWEAAGGVMLALDFWDFLDPFSRWGTRRARAGGLYDHAFLYGEAMWQPLDNWGMPSLRLSPQDPLGGSGQPWTLHVGVAVELL